ncbi:MAG: transcription termination factor NusA, partial [Planctomycetes bacterium]|nr:transcription termination factor NusA [Planctomycetota bacterium]
GERVRALIYEVKEDISQVKIILTRTHPDFIRRLFEQEVPEIAEQVIEIKALAREAGYRTKVAVMSHESKVDAVGACVGVRGSRIKNIVDELGGEKIDIVRWNESSKLLIENALRPAEVRETALCFELNRASVVVSEDQLSLAIGKRGQNVRLAARLTNWDIDILTPHEYAQGMEKLIETLRSVEGMDDTLIDKVMAMGIISVLDIDEVGAEPLVESLEVDESLAKLIVTASRDSAQRLADAKEKSKATQAVLGEEKAKPKEGTGEKDEEVVEDKVQEEGTGELDSEEDKKAGEEEVQEEGTGESNDGGLEEESSPSAGAGEDEVKEEGNEDDSGEEDDSSSAEASQKSEGTA